MSNDPTATEAALRENMRLNIRRQKARMMASIVFDSLRDYIPDACLNSAYDKLIERLEQIGPDFLTDEDRKKAGLPPRGPDGWTVLELAALEHARLAAISSVFAMQIDPKNLATS